MSDAITPLLTAKEAASRLRISVSSLRQIPAEDLPSIPILGRRRVWSVDDINSYIEKRAGRSVTAEPASEWDRACSEFASNTSKSIGTATAKHAAI